MSFLPLPGLSSGWQGLIGEAQSFLLGAVPSLERPGRCVLFLAW